MRLTWLWLVNAVLILWAGTALAQDIDLTLYHANANDLSPAAREAYEAAAASLNHMDHVGAIRSLAVAAENAPDVVELQILFIDTARQHVRLRNMEVEEGLQIAGQVVSAYERILSRENLPDWVVSLLQPEEEHISHLIDNFDEIYAEKMEEGSEYFNQMNELKTRLAAAREQDIHDARQAYLRRVNNPQSFGVNAPDAINANPLLLPSDHYRVANSQAEVGPVNPMLPIN